MRIRPPIAIPLLVAAILVMPCAFVLGTDTAPSRRALERLGPERSQLEAAFAGTLPELEEGTEALVDGVWRRELALPAGECVGAVLTAATAYPISVGLAEGPRALASGSAAPRGSGHAWAVAWCAPAERPLSLTLEARVEVADHVPPSARDLGGELAFRLYRGPTEAFDLYSLPAGRPVPAALEARWAVDRVARAEAALAGLAPGDPLEAPRPLNVDAGALLYPASRATQRALRLAGLVGTDLELAVAAPRIDPRSPGLDARLPRLPEPPHDPLARVGRALFRVLAVVDPGALPLATESGQVPCVRLRFARRDAGVAADVRRVVLEDGAADEELARPAPTVAEDAFCPGDPLRLYAVPPEDQADYAMHVSRGEGAGRRQPAAMPRRPRPRELVWMEERCEAGEAERCVEAAGAHREGTFGETNATRAAELLARACGLGDERACLQRARLREGEEPEATLATLRAACVGEPPSAVACGELGDRHRLGRNARFDPMAARAFYRRACESGRGEASQRACANAEAMDLLQL